MNRAFSLIELSIVLVILGLLTGGILAGQSLIRAAELRSVTTQTTRYLTSFLTFRDKYMGWPGDLTNATAFWGDDNTYCADAAVTNGTPGTCNGNGDGTIANPSGGNVTGERFQIWKQLALAGLIEGSYTGISGAGSSTATVTGANVPAGKISSSLFEVSACCSGGGSAFSNADGGYGNTMTFGGTGWVALLKPEEAWNIDTKIDDTLPDRGKVMARFWDTCTTATAWNDHNAPRYKLDSSETGCALHFPRVF